MTFTIRTNDLAVEKEVTLIILHEDTEVIRFPVKSKEINVEIPTDGFEDHETENLENVSFVILDKDIKPFKSTGHVFEGSIVGVYPELDSVIGYCCTEPEVPENTLIESNVMTAQDLIDVLKQYPGNTEIYQHHYSGILPMLKTDIKEQKQIGIKLQSGKEMMIKASDIGKPYTVDSRIMSSKQILFIRSPMDV